MLCLTLGGHDTTQKLGRNLNRFRIISVSFQFPTLELSLVVNRDMKQKLGGNLSESYTVSVSFRSPGLVFCLLTLLRHDLKQNPEGSLGGLDVVVMPFQFPTLKLIGVVLTTSSPRAEEQPCGKP